MVVSATYSRKTLNVRRRNSTRKVPKTFRLNPEKLAAARRVLGAKTATEAIETALDMVVFREELIKGTRAMLGVIIESPDSQE